MICYKVSSMYCYTCTAYSLPFVLQDQVLNSPISITPPLYESSLSSPGTQQLQTMPPLQRSRGWLPAKTQVTLRPQLYWWPRYQQWFGTEMRSLFIHNLYIISYINHTYFYITISIFYILVFINLK